MPKWLVLTPWIQEGKISTTLKKPLNVNKMEEVSVGATEEGSPSQDTQTARFIALRSDSRMQTNKDGHFAAVYKLQWYTGCTENSDDLLITSYLKSA